MASGFSGRDLKELPFGIVLLIELAAVLSVALAPQHWLRAVAGMTVGLLVAGLLRLALSNEQAGLLRVRRRSFDVACYWGLAVLTFAVAVALPQR
ncbi:MAG: hypothetical protein QOE23_2914 [Pseudonocardiales bacterium]|jgi:uncharacterized membrane protein YdcZ (DUF606 family)|nr:hypothetical protein [Pseudonocardiales bacterium]